MVTVKISVVCPICHSRVDDEMTLGSDNTLWGLIPLTSQGTIDVTHTSRKVSEHMSSHTVEELSAAYEAHYRAQLLQAQRIIDRNYTPEGSSA